MFFAMAFLTFFRTISVKIALRIEPVRPVAVSRTPRNRRLRPERWADALEEPRNLQAEYEEWRAGLPESLADSRTAQLLENVCDVDLRVPALGGVVVLDGRRSSSCPAVSPGCSSSAPPQRKHHAPGRRVALLAQPPQLVFERG